MCGADIEAVRDALAYITACLIDSTCVLEGSPARAAEISGDDHDDHDDHGHGAHDGEGAKNHLGLKLGLGAAFFVLTVVSSYLPMLFMWSEHYNVRTLQRHTQKQCTRTAWQEAAGARGTARPQ